ncbi:MAG: ABC transporter substrate-binding protein [Asticcacaulis sp.]
MIRNPPKPAQSSRPPLIWYARCPTLTAMALAASQGVFQREFFQRDGVNMVSVRENSTPSVRQGHLDHSLSNLIREADAATAIWAYAQNERSRLLAMGETWHCISIVARPGARLDGLSGIAGRRLSLPREAGAFSPAQARTLRAWENVLSLSGTAAKDVEFATVVADHPSVPFGDVARREVEALLGGHTDLAVLYGAKGLELMRAANLQEIHRFEPETIRDDPRLGGLVELRALTVDEALLDAHPDTVARIVSTLLDIETWVRDFPKEALRHVAYEGQVEAADAAQAYGGLMAEGTRLDLDPARLARIDALHEWLKQKHIIPQHHSLAEWRRPEILTAAETKLKIVA